MKRDDPLTTATLNAWDFEMRLQGRDPDAERAALMAAANADARHAMAIVPLVLASALVGALIAVVVIAWLLGPLY